MRGAKRSDGETGQAGNKDNPTIIEGVIAWKLEWDLVRGPHQGQQSFTDCINRPDRRLHPTNTPDLHNALATRGPSTEDYHVLIGLLATQAPDDSIGTTRGPCDCQVLRARGIMAGDLDTDILTLTTMIVSAHISYNHIGADILPELIQLVYRSLAIAGTTEAEPTPLTPAVPIRKSVFPDYIVCLEDGKKLKMLKRHLQTSYGMTPKQYRQKWGLATDYPMVATSYASHNHAGLSNPLTMSAVLLRPDDLHRKYLPIAATTLPFVQGKLVSCASVALATG